MRKKVVAVIGGRNCKSEVEQISLELGRKLTKVVDILVSGGLGGVMKAVTQGFKEEGGLTIGILPGYDKKNQIPLLISLFPQAWAWQEMFL